MSDFLVRCAPCGHALTEHDGYGCGHWFERRHWNAGSMCPCELTRRQLLELDEVPS